MERCQTGTLVRWNDERGFGFIRPADGGPDLFFHVTLFTGRGRPREGMEVVYRVADDGERGRRAVNVGAAFAQAEPWLDGVVVSLVVVLSFFTTIVAYGWLYEIPHWLPLVYLGLSAAAYGAYWSDKDKAVRRAWRTPEARLHWLAVLGGWPGALVAQWHLRHKNRKGAFQILFWIAVSINIAAMMYFFMPRWSQPIVAWVLQAR